MSLRMVFRLAALGAALLPVTGLPAALPERRIFQFGDFTIEASAGDEAYVEALALRLVDFKLPPPPAPPALKLSLGDLEKRRDYFLGRVAAYLGLAKPTELMATAYDTALKTARAGDFVPPTALPRRYALWRRPELLARFDSGEKIPGFNQDASGVLSFSFDFKRVPGPDGMNHLSEVSSQMARAWQEIVWPVHLSGVEGKTPDDDAVDGLARLSEYHTAWIDAAVGGTLRANVVAVLRQAVETGVTWHYLTSKDRRWFCEGVANYVAYKVVEGELGAGEARGYYDLGAELMKSAAFAPQVDLAAWPAAEDMEKAPDPAGLEPANRAFATKVIADFCARHGNDVLPNLFREIGKTKREKATIDTVYRAGKKVTGENLRASLPKAGGGH